MVVYPNIEYIRELQEPYTQEVFCLKCDMPRMSLHRIYSGHRVDLDTLKAIAAAFKLDVNELILPEPSSDDRLCHRISRLGLWPDLTEAVRSSVIIGGASAMRTYTEESRKLVSPGLGTQILETILSKPSQVKNPTIPADVDAMQSVIRAADLFLRPLAGKLGCGVSYLAEELMDHESDLKPYLGEAANHVHTQHEFFRLHLNIVRTIADPLDGSVNHKRGIPMFCSAVALLVEDQPRVAAIFDPVHNVVYSALLPGPYNKPERNAVATAWEISTGHSVDLIELARRQKTGELILEGVAIHLPRKNPDKCQEMITRLEVIATSVDTVYMLNAGIPAMVLVAKGGLAAFVNPWTNLHDVAAGEVLCRATRCLVTDWNGAECDPILCKYRSKTDMEVNHA